MKPEAAFIKFDDAKAEEQQITAIVKKGFIVRTRADGRTYKTVVVIIRNSRRLSDAVRKLFPPIITDLIFATKNIREDFTNTLHGFQAMTLEE
jgi:hypothetical protein